MTQSSALAVARELRDVGVTVAYAGRDNWRRTLVNEVRRRKGPDGPTVELTLRTLGDELRGSSIVTAVRAERGEAARLADAEDQEAQRRERAEAGACWWCDDARFVLDGEPDIDGTRAVQPCPVCNPGVDSREHLLERSELPAQQHGWTFATFPADGRKSEARDRVAAWVEGIVAGATEPLVIAGANGRGKTSLASAAVNALLDAGVRVRFAYVPGLLGEIRRRFGGEGDEATEYLERLLRVPVLVLDDLAAPHLTPWVRETITRIIGERLMSEFPTLITLDEPEDWIAENFHPRVASRLKLFGVVTVPGEDLRERTQRERWWAN